MFHVTGYKCNCADDGTSKKLHGAKQFRSVVHKGGWYRGT